MRTRMRAVIAFFSAVFFVLGGVGLFAATSYGLTIGTRVQTTDRLTVRATSNGTIVGYQANGSQGTVIAGPVSSGSYQWAKVNYDTGVDGWSATNWLQEVSTVTTNTANTTLAPTAFPLDMRATSLPEEKTITFNTAIHAEATNAVVSMNVYDPDVANEGTLYINGRGSIALFGDQGTTANDTLTKTLTFNTPVSWWNNGSNSLRFVHTSSTGFTINSLNVSFPGGFPPPSSTPSVPTTKPSFKYGTASGGLVVGMNDLLTLTVDAGPEGDLQLYKLTFYARTSNLRLSNPTFTGPNGSVGRVEISAGTPNLITVYFDSLNNPTDSIIQAGFSKTFTLRANVSIPDSSLPSGVSVGLKGDMQAVNLSPVSSLVSSNIIWSPMTSSKSRIALTTADWTNSYGLSGCYTQAGLGQDCLPRTLQRGDMTAVGKFYSLGSESKGGLVFSGATKVTLGNFALESQGEAVRVTQVGLRLLSGSAAQLAGPVAIWDGLTQVGSAIFAGSNQTVISTLTSPVTLNPALSAAQAPKFLTLTGSVSPIGLGSSGDSNVPIHVGLDNVNLSATKGTGSVSGSNYILSSASTPQGNGFRVLKSYPQTISVLSNKAEGVTGANDLLTFVVTANQSGDIVLGSLAFGVETQNATVSGLTLISANGSVSQSPNRAVLGPNNESGIYFLFDSPSNTQDRVISAGSSKTYTLRGIITPSPFATGQIFVRAYLKGDDPSLSSKKVLEPLKKFSGVAVGIPSPNFIWSPVSTTSFVTWETNDWLGGWNLTHINFSSLSKTITFNSQTQPPTTLSAKLEVNNSTQEVSITRGEPVTVVWSSQDAFSCDILETYSNVKKNALSGTWTATPAKTTNYAIQCITSAWTGPGDTTNIVSKSVIVEVKDPIPVSEPPAPITPPATTTSCLPNQILTYSKSGEFDLPVPAGCYQAEVFVWGAGGGGAANESGVGGSGGYAHGYLSFTDLKFLKILVGEGGKNTGQTSVGGGGAGTYRNDYKSTYGGSGGGLSGVFSGPISQSNALLIAGAGGGAGKCGGTTGGGAGAKGLERSGKVSGEIGGGGGSLTSGGSATLPGQAGSALKGGSGGKDGAAGGGAGYFGGGGGSGLCSSGGGGSGYYQYPSSVLRGQEANGGASGGGNGSPQTIVAGSSSQYYATPTGYGGSASTPAGDGRVVIVFTSGKGSLPGPSFTSNPDRDQMAAVLESIRNLLEDIKQSLGF